MVVVLGKANRVLDKVDVGVFSFCTLNLTLVLAFVMQVATGDQPADIEEQIRLMCMQYINNPNAIILSVTSANQDLANSDALKMAREASGYKKYLLKSTLLSFDLQRRISRANISLHRCNLF